MAAAVLLLVALALIGYAYVGYPALMFLRARFRPRAIRRAPIRPNVTIVIAA